MKLGQAWHTDPRLEQAFHRFHVAVELAVIAAFLWFLWSHLNRRRRAEAGELSEPTTKPASASCKSGEIDF
jgi:hypothetical protein